MVHRVVVLLYFRVFILDYDEMLRTDVLCYYSIIKRSADGSTCDGKLSMMPPSTNVAPHATIERSEEEPFQDQSAAAEAAAHLQRAGASDPQGSHDQGVPRRLQSETPDRLDQLWPKRIPGVNIPGLINMRREISYF